MKAKLFLLVVLVLFFSSCLDNIGLRPHTAFSQKQDNVVLIPQPKELKKDKGYFKFDQDTRFVVDVQSVDSPFLILRPMFQKVEGWDLKVEKQKPEDNYILLKENLDLEDEAYQLVVTPDNIQIEASSYAGFIYAQESLRQLLPTAIEKREPSKNKEWKVPSIEIMDGPRFKWRGVMLDVSRHFFEKEYIFKTIERLAYLKMNTLHLHLVDDQGWRIHIKKYPKLTEVGAFRMDQEEKHWNARSVPDSDENGTFGGYYTQEDIKEIVAHAAKYGINVVPEIEMPAHVMSAIASYPELSCFETPIAVPSGGVWPITEIYCAGKESTFEFLENVLLEVMELFPSQYIHIGGDEATKTNWEKCPRCQDRVKDEGLANVEELQSYFIKRIEKFLSSHDRTLIGWDEILEGGLAPGATVMSWRGTEGGLKASEAGHDVVMTPESYAYFNIYQGDQDREPLAFGGYVPLKKVYSFDPVVDSMTPEQAKHVLGAQANLWSEYITTDRTSEYMMFPRLTAMAEVLWSSKDSLNWKSFSYRLKTMFSRFDVMGINYATSAYNVSADAIADVDKGIVSVSLQNEFPNSTIKYTVNGQALNANSIDYTKPLIIDSSTVLKAAVFEEGQLKGTPLMKNFDFHKAVGSTLTIKPEPPPKYSGSGPKTLVDVLNGSKNFTDGKWLGWVDQDVEIVMDLGEKKQINQISVGSIENQGADIYFPALIKIQMSNDGDRFVDVENFERTFKANGASSLKKFNFNFEPRETRYLRINLEPYKNPIQGRGAWIFLDEISIE